MRIVNRTFASLAAATLLTAALGSLAPAQAAESVEAPSQDWSFDGPFGKFDPVQLQRGLVVYQGVCAGCHGLERIAFRNLQALGLTEDEIKAFADTFQVQNAEPNDQGEMFMRQGRPSDRFPSPFPNDEAARAANGGALPPDLSLVVKAREGGADYIYGLMVGYTEPPAGYEVMEGLYYNKYFPGHDIAMPPPLQEGVVSFADDTEATVPQMAKDVTAFLAWAAEPKMEQRKAMGLKVVLFLLVFTGLVLGVKRYIWRDIH